jgi:transposase
LLPEAWIAPQAVRDQRALLRHRAALVRVATALKCRVHAILADRGVGVEESLWSSPGRVMLVELPLPAAQRAVVTDCLALIDAISPLSPGWSATWSPGPGPTHASRRCKLYQGSGRSRP